MKLSRMLVTDCFVMGSRLVIILDDLLWVLTDSQLKAALHFIDSLGGLVEKATVLERKTKAARKLEVSILTHIHRIHNVKQRLIYL